MANTLGLPNNLYLSGAAQPLDLSPFLNFYQNQQIRKQAKNDALEKYYNDFSKSVNPAGMRTQDIENGWSQKVSDWQNFYHTNKAAILKPKLDNGKALNEFQSRYQDVLQDTQKSKAAAENIKQLFPIISDPEKRGRLTESTLGSIATADKSIYDNGYKPIDPMAIDYNAKPAKELTANDLEGFNKYFTNGLKMSEGNPQVIIDPKTKTKVLTTESAFTPQDFGVIADRAEQLYQTNSQFKEFIDGMANEKDFDDLNQTFKQVFGHEIDIQHPEEMAAAWALKSNQQKVTNTATNQYSPPTIKIDNSSGKAKQGWVLDLVDAANSGDPQQVQNVASQLFAGNQQYVKLQKAHVENGNLYFDYIENEFDPNKIVKDANGNDKKGAYVDKKKVFFVPIGDLNEPQTQAKMAAFQQKFFGSMQKAKTTPYYKGQGTKQTQKPQQTKTFKGVPQGGF